MAVSYDQALSFYTKNRNKFPGMTATQAVDQIVRGGEIPVAAVEAAPAAIPVAAAAPVPMAAPVVEAVPEAAPAPVAEYVGPNQAALRAYNLANPEAPAPVAVKGKPTDYAAVARNAATQRELEGLNINAEIERTATIDPEIQKLLTNRQARYDTELSEVDKDRKQATWMAVAQAGMKMAQSQSPYFMQALASGMEAGISGYSEAKAKAAEKKARLQDAKEDLVLKAKELRDQVVRDTIGARLAAQQGAAAKTALQKDALGLIVAGETAPDVVEAAKLGNKLTSAQISKVFNDIRTDNARLALARSTAGPGGADGVKLSQIGPIANSAISENNRLTEQLNDPYISARFSPAQKSAMQGQIQSNNQIIAYARSIQRQKIGMGGLTFGQEK